MKNGEGHSQELSGAEALLAQIQANGVDTIFGLPGGQLDHFFDAMARSDQPLQFIGSRHEQGAAYMAFGYARALGRPSVYVVVPGPGVLNTTAALCSAYATNTPVLCLTGQIPSHAIGKGIGFLHELPDQLATLASLTKWAQRADSPREAPELVNDAFQQMLSGRPRPVSLEMAMDVMAQRETTQVLAAAQPLPTPPLDEDEAGRAAALLAAAKNPLIVAGGGALHAADSLHRVADFVQAPVITFRNGRGVISDRDYLSLNLPAGYEKWKHADVVMGVGTRLELQLLQWRMGPDMQLIRIEIDPDEIARVRAPDIALLADADEALSTIFEKLSSTYDRAHSRADELQGLKAKIRAEIESVQPQMAYLDVIRRALPDDGIFVDEITQVGYASWYGFPVYAPRQLISCGYQGTLGFGYATALGVQVAQPDKTVVNIAGDGGFLFTSNEMATAAQYGIPLVTVLFNNGKFQNVQRQQDDWFGGRHIASDLQNPDFCAYAESFGIRAARVEDPAGLETALKAAIGRRQPELIEVKGGDMGTPWPFIIRDPCFPDSEPAI